MFASFKITRLQRWTTDSLKSKMHEIETSLNERGGGVRSFRENMNMKTGRCKSVLKICFCKKIKSRFFSGGLDSRCPSLQLSLDVWGGEAFLP
jgi:hypothetical protein